MFLRSYLTSQLKRPFNVNYHKLYSGHHPQITHLLNVFKDERTNNLPDKLTQTRTNFCIIAHINWPRITLTYQMSGISVTQECNDLLLVRTTDEYLSSAVSTDPIAFHYILLMSLWNQMGAIIHQVKRFGLRWCADVDVTWILIEGFKVRRTWMLLPDNTKWHARSHCDIKCSFGWLDMILVVYRSIWPR